MLGNVKLNNLWIIPTKITDLRNIYYKINVLSFSKTKTWTRTEKGIKKKQTDLLNNNQHNRMKKGFHKFQYNSVDTFQYTKLLQSIKKVSSFTN